MKDPVQDTQIKDMKLDQIPRIEPQFWIALAHDGVSGVLHQVSILEYAELVPQVEVLVYAFILFDGCAIT